MLQPRDIATLRHARDYRGGDIPRSRLIDAFKRGGATVGVEAQSLVVRFERQALPLSRYTVQLDDRYPTFRAVLREMAASVLKHCKVD